MSKLKKNSKTVCKLLIINATSRCVATSAYFLKQSLQTHFVRSCRDSMSSMQCSEGYMVTGGINSFRLLIFVLIKMANYAKKKIKTTF